MNELIALLQKAYDDGIITSIILTKILKVKNDLKLSDAEFNKIDDQIRVTTYLKKVDERKGKGIVYFGDLTKQYRITEEDKELLKAKKPAAQTPALSTKPSTHSEQAAAAPPIKPAKTAPAKQEKATAAAPASKQEKTAAAVPAVRPDGDFVLIVDDNPNHVKLTKTLMEKNGFVCDTADSPHEALKIVLQKKPMLILCDFNFGIGKQTGLDLLHELKSKKMTIPFIIISAYFQKEFVDYAFGIGVTDYLTKPIEPEELLTTIKKHLGAKK